jgi:uncharacterized protein (TIGR02217 family)
MTAPFLPSRWVITPADNTDDPDVFPILKGQMFKIEKTPVWSTKTDISVSGVERRRSLFSYPIWRFQLGYGVLRDGAAYLELQRLITFFNLKSGSMTAFFFYDKDDYFAVAMPFGTGDGVTATFQVTRTTSIGGAGLTFSEPVRGFDGTPTFYVNGVATSATVGPLGTVTFASPPANGTSLTWTGSFYFLCRFSADDLSGLSQVASGLWALNAFGFQTFKP